MVTSAVSPTGNTHGIPAQNSGPDDSAVANTTQGPGGKSASHGESYRQFLEDAKDGFSRREALEASLRVPKRDTPEMLDLVLKLQNAEHKRVFFSDLALTESAELGSHADELASRPPVTGVTMTIDSYESYDLDDGLSFRREADGTLVVGVSVADVDAWIRPGSALDASARQRRVSRYYGGIATAPMLPLPLSEDLMSLRGGTTRLTRTMEMRFSPQGELLGQRLFRSTFYNQHRLDKHDATRARDGHGAGATNPDLADALRTMGTIAAKLVVDDGAAAATFAQAPISMGHMLQVFIVTSCKLLGGLLSDAHLHTSFRNQDSPTERSYYAKDAAGHASLNTPAYVRWTSPIRRYADLDVHRAMGRLIDARFPKGRLLDLDDRMRDIQLRRANGHESPRLKFLGLLLGKWTKED